MKYSTSYVIIKDTRNNNNTTQGNNKTSNDKTKESKVGKKVKQNCKIK